MYSEIHLHNPRFPSFLPFPFQISLFTFPGQAVISYPPSPTADSFSCNPVPSPGIGVVLFYYSNVRVVKTNVCGPSQRSRVSADVDVPLLLPFLPGGESLPLFYYCSPEPRTTHDKNTPSSSSFRSFVLLFLVVGDILLSSSDHP